MNAVWRSDPSRWLKAGAQVGWPAGILFSVDKSLEPIMIAGIHRTSVWKPVKLVHRLVKCTCCNHHVVKLKLSFSITVI